MTYIPNGSEEGPTVYDFQGHSMKVLCVAFTPDGRRLLSGGEDKIIIVWDLASGQRINDIKASVDWLGNQL